jgi:hypothetical protein
MKLSQETKIELLSKADGQPLIDLVDDACELLTLQILLWVQERAKILKGQYDALRSYSPKRPALAAEINGLRKTYVALAEAP